MGESFTLQSREVLYDKSWGKVRIDQVDFDSGIQQEFLALDDGDGVQIAAITDKDEIILVDLSRYAIGKKNFLELPGGGVGQLPIIEAGRKELAEETGLWGEHWDFLCRRPKAAHKNSAWSTIFLVRGIRELTKEERQKYPPDPLETLNSVLRIPLEEAFAEVDVSIFDSMTCGVIDRLHIMRLQGRL